MTKDRWIGRSAKTLGKIQCPDHGLQPMYTLISARNTLAVGCKKHYHKLPVMAEKDIPYSSTVEKTPTHSCFICHKEIESSSTASSIHTGCMALMTPNKEVAELIRAAHEKGAQFEHERLRKAILAMPCVEEARPLKHRILSLFPNGPQRDS